MAEKYVIQLEVDSKEAVKGIDKLNDSLKQTSQSAKKQMSKAEQGVEGVGVASNTAAKKGVKRLTTSFRVLGTAMKAAGIGIIISALSFLYSTIKENQDIMDVLNTGFEALSIVGGEVSRIFVSVLKSVNESALGFTAFGVHIENLMTLVLFPFKVAIKGVEIGLLQLQLAQAAFDLDLDKSKEITTEILMQQKELFELGKGYVGAFVNIAANVPDLLSTIGAVGEGVIDGVSDINLAVVLNTAKTNVALKKTAELAVVTNAGLIEKYNRLAEKQRQIRDNVSLSVKDRIAANDLLKVELEQQNELMIKNAKIIERAAQAQFKKTKSDADNIILQQAKNDLLAIEAQTTGFLSEQEVNRVALDNEKNNLELTNHEAKVIRQNEQKAFLAEMDENAARRLQTTLNNLINENTAETLRLEEKRRIFKEGTQAYVDANNELLDYQQTNAQEQIRIGKEIIAQDKIDGDAKIQIDKNVANAKLSIAGNTMALIGEIAGKGSKIGKAMAIGQATISGYQGVQNAFSTASESPITAAFPAYPYIQAGLAGAFAALNLAKIVSTNPSGGGGGAGLSTVSTPVQTPAFNIVGQGEGNQIATALGQQQQTPIQAFVVSQDVTTAQSLENGIIQGATLGG